VVVITLIDLACDWVVWHAIEPGDAFLIAAAGLSFLLYVVLRTIRKKTRWLSSHA